MPTDNVHFLNVAADDEVSKAHDRIDAEFGLTPTTYTRAIERQVDERTRLMNKKEYTEYARRFIQLVEDMNEIAFSVYERKLPDSDVVQRALESATKLRHTFALPQSFTDYFRDLGSVGKTSEQDTSVTQQVFHGLTRGFAYQTPNISRL